MTDHMDKFLGTGKYAKAELKAATKAAPADTGKPNKAAKKAAKKSKAKIPPFVAPEEDSHAKEKAFFKKSGLNE